MKILIVTFTYPPNRDGVSEAASVMARAFAEDGHSVDIVTRPTTPKRPVLGENGIRIQEFALEGGIYWRVPLSGQVEEFLRFLHEGHWSAIIFHSYSSELYAALPYLGNIPGKKILVSHGYGALIRIKMPHFPYGYGLWFSNLLQSLKMPFWLRKFDRVVYLSRKSDLRGFYDHFLARLSGHKGIRIIPNGVDAGIDCGDGPGFRARHGIRPDEFVFLCVANYSQRKDQGFACRAFRSAAVDGSVLVFIGSEFNAFSEQWQEEDRNSSRKSGRVIWLEHLDRESTLAAIAGCDCMVLSASHEAQPIALLEAMRDSKPWIARKAGCIDELPGGFCIATEGEMAAKMTQVSADHELCRELGGNGRLAVEKIYHLDNYKREYLHLVDELLR
jgi:glycosyltransferase involved in cell wall biosynthesis